MHIVNSTMEDIELIFYLYEEGTLYQKLVAGQHWLGFERSFVEKEIEEKRQWKIIENNQVACIFAITFNDPLIWKEKDKEPSVYIHRIATDPLFRGNGYVKHIVAWAKEYAQSNGRRFIRMDTWSSNEKLNNYYIRCGFTYLGTTWPEVNGHLPLHYGKEAASLFEIAV